MYQCLLSQEFGKEAKLVCDFIGFSSLIWICFIPWWCWLGDRKDIRLMKKTCVTWKRW